MRSTVSTQCGYVALMDTYTCPNAMCTKHMLLGGKNICSWCVGQCDKAWQPQTLDPLYQDGLRVWLFLQVRQNRCSVYVAIAGPKQKPCYSKIHLHHDRPLHQRVPHPQLHLSPRSAAPCRSRAGRMQTAGSHMRGCGGQHQGRAVSAGTHGPPGAWWRDMWQEAAAA